MFNKEVFGQRLRELRKKANEKQDDLAESLGITKTQVSDMENGKSGTNLERLYQLCEYYKVSADYLLGITDDPAWRGR